MQQKAMQQRPTQQRTMQQNALPVNWFGNFWKIEFSKIRKKYLEKSRNGGGGCLCQKNIFRVGKYKKILTQWAKSSKKEKKRKKTKSRTFWLQFRIYFFDFLEDVGHTLYLDSKDENGLRFFKNFWGIFWKYFVSRGARRLIGGW